jgi:hypothetical protein
MQSIPQKHTAEVQISREGAMPVVEVSVPHGTRLVDLVKLNDLISREINPKVSPRGCGPCLSGLDFRIRERFEEVIRVDLEAMQIIR